MGQGAQAAGELGLVHVPVAQTGKVIIAFAEPAVVHDHHLHAHLAGRLGNGADLLCVKVKQGGLPVVDEDGPALVLPGTPAQVETDGPVELTAHVAQALGGEYHGRLRCGKGLARLERPAEVEGIDPQSQAGLVELGILGVGLKTAGVDQSHAPAASGVLGGLMVTQHHKGILLMAGRTADAAYGVDSLGQRHPHRLPLPGVGAAQGNEVVLTSGEVQAYRRYPLQLHGALAPIAHPYSPGDQIVLLQHAVQQLNLQAGAAVPQLHRQGLGGHTLIVEGGQPLQGILSFPDGVTHIAQIHGAASLSTGGLHAGHTEVAYAAGGVFLRQGIQRVGAVLPYFVGVRRKTTVLMHDAVGQVTAPQAGTVVGMQQHSRGVHLHLIGGGGSAQSNSIAAFIKENHNWSSLNHRVRKWAACHLGRPKQAAPGTTDSYLPPVRAMPSINWRWKMRYKISMGIIANKLPAMSTG